MKNKEQLKPLTMEQRKFAEDNYRLIKEFLKKSKLDSEEYFGIWLSFISGNIYE